MTMDIELDVKRATDAQSANYTDIIAAAMTGDHETFEKLIASPETVEAVRLGVIKWLTCS